MVDILSNKTNKLNFMSTSIIILIAVPNTWRVLLCKDFSNFPKTFCAPYESNERLYLAVVYWTLWSKL